MLRLLVFLTVISITTPLFADVTGTPSVIDGDTLDISGARIRLHGWTRPQKTAVFESPKVGPRLDQGWTL